MASCPRSSRPNGGRNEGKLLLPEADILTRSFDGRKSAEDHACVAASKPTDCDTYAVAY